MFGESNDLALHYNSFSMNMQTEFCPDLTLKIPHVILAKAEMEEPAFHQSERNSLRRSLMIERLRQSSAYPLLLKAWLGLRKTLIWLFWQLCYPLPVNKRKIVSAIHRQ